MKNKFWVITSSLFIVLTGILFFYHINTTKKFGYVTTMKVFDAFKLKKELESDYKKVQMVKQSYLDSLKLTIQELMLKSKNGNNEEQISNYKKHYLLKENQFNEENQRLFDQYNEQIWKQINQYIEDYGKENGYDYLFGASGQGTIMYAGKKEDLTKEISDYVNTKYSGKKSN